MQRLHTLIEPYRPPIVSHRLLVDLLFDPAGNILLASTSHVMSIVLNILNGMSKLS